MKSTTSKGTEARRHAGTKLDASAASCLRASVPSCLSAPAFTLIELIISIGLVLVIMLGVNFVFKMTSDTINAGQSLNENMRNSRASQSVMFEDFSKYAPDGASLLLKSRSQLAFRNQADQDRDTDYNESAGQVARDNAKATIVDLDNDGSLTSRGEFASAALPGERSHRVDVISYFARGKFTRQTGGDVGGGGVASDEDPLAPLVSDMSSNEAWIWYGHLTLPHNSGLFNLDGISGNPKTNPGDGTASSNPNNFFAASWALGRFAGLLVEPYDHDNSNSPDVILDRVGSGTGKPQVFIGRNPTATNDSRQPLTWQSTAYFERQNGSAVSNSIRPIQLIDSRFDLIGTSIAAYRGILATAIGTGAISGGRWWNDMMLDSRFETTPFLVKPIKAPAYAAQAPFFMNSCTQFIVEYAGDFVKQNRDPNDTAAGGTGDAAGVFGDVQDAFYGYVSGDYVENTAGQDGEIDFIVIGTGANARKQIRWYGLPRDVNGDGRVIGNANGNLQSSQMIDVVPLRDIVRVLNLPPAPFERDMNTELPAQADYLGATPLSFNNEYTCAWGPSDTVRPRMIRITMVVDDPTGRTVEPQTHEYVFNLPAGE